MTDRRPRSLPSTGSFPGYKQSADLFTAWSNALRSQADSWNDVWGKLKTGTYSSRDYVKALVDNVDASATFLEQAVLTLTGSSSPAWVTIPWPPTSEVQVKVRKPVDSSHVLRMSALSLLGKENAGGELKAQVRVVGSFAIAVSIQGDVANVELGEYIGFIFSDHYSDPLAIVTVSVTEPHPIQDADD